MRFRADEEVARISTAFIDHELFKNPQIATLLGLSLYADRLSDLSVATLAQQANRECGFVRELERIDETALSAEAVVDRALLIWLLRRRQCLFDAQPWASDPGFYLAAVADGISSSLMRITDPQELRASLRGRLRGVVTILDAAQQQLNRSMCSKSDAVEALILVSKISQWLRTGALPPTARDGDRADVQAALEHLQRFTNFLGELSEHATLEAPQAKPEALWNIVDDCVVWRTVSEFDRIVQSELEMTREMLDRLTREQFHGASARAIRGHLRNDGPKNGRALLDEYSSAMEKAYDHIRDTDLEPILPNDPCNVVSVPASAALSSLLPSYLSPSVNGRFPGSLRVVVPDTHVEEDVAHSVLSANGRAWIPVMTVHETVPGHHAHLGQRARHHLIRDVAVSYSTVEGWATFAERLMYESGFFSLPTEQFAFWDLRRLRALRAECVLNLHWRGRSQQDTAIRLTEESGLAPAIVREELRWYQRTPEVAAAHFAGCHAIAQAVATMGNLHAFVRILFGSGALPIRLLVQSSVRSGAFQVAQNTRSYLHSDQSM